MRPAHRGSRVVVACLLLAACGGDDDAASAIDGGAGIDGGGGGSPDAGSSEPLTMDQVVTACVVGAACGLIESSGCWSDGVYLWRTDMVRCLADAAGDCDAALACRGMTRELDGACVESCDGAIITDCEGGYRIEQDCASDPLSSGPMCAPTGDDAFPYACAAGACSGPADESCDGDVLQDCYAPASLLLQEDCALDGFECVSDVGARCSDGTAVACDTFDETCDPDANAVVFCTDGYEVRRPCDRVSPGSTCHEQDNGRAYCGWGAECQPSGQDIGTCVSATTLSYCGGGVLLDIDCTALGFAGCEDERCVP